MMYFSVDQIGEDHIECENDNGEIYYFKIKDVPKNIKEGEILKLNKNGSLTKDKNETKERKRDIYTKFTNLLE